MAVNQGKRGMKLEEMLEMTNHTYRIKNIALVEKIPTPWRVYFDKKGKGSRATPQKKSSVDFGGTIKGGQSIYFEAKSTINKTSFPLKNIEQHQIDYLLFVKSLGGIGFFIIEFSSIDRRFVAPVEFVNEYWMKQSIGGRKSIPLQDFMDNCFLIPTTYVPADYLKVVNPKL